MRRDKEGVEIVALAKLLPFPEEITSKLDKGSIIRLTTSYLRMKKFTQKEGDALLEELKQQQTKAITNGEETECKEIAKNKVEEGALMLESLNGFVIFISRKGRVLYVADNVVKHLGIPQHDMIGNNIVEFIHPDDQKELAKQFIVKRPGQQSYSGYGVNDSGDSPLSMEVHFFDDSDKTKSSSIVDYIQERSFFMRIRSVTPKKGTGGKGKVIGYRLVQCSGRLKLKSSSNSKGYNVEGLICICRPAQPSPILEIRMDGNMFMSRHNLDMSFTFCDPRIITLVGYEPHELIGKTAYQFHNPLDVGKISSCHSNLIVKGTSVSKYYRFLGKHSDWIWMQTRATIIYNTSNEAQYVVCQNYVIGKDEGDKYLMLERMQRAAQGMCGQSSNSEGEDSGIESGCSTSSPCPSAGESSPGYSIYNSPGFMTTNEIDMDVDISRTEEQQVIQDPIKHAQTHKITKPKELNTVSFAGLSDKAKSDTENILKSNDAGEDMEGVTTSENAQDVSSGSDKPCKAPEVKFERPNERTDSSSSCGSALRLDSNYTQNGSPASDADSLCSSSDISSVTSPPDLFSFETKDHKTLPVIEDEGDENMDENMIKDLLEITKDDYEKDANGKDKEQTGSDYTNVLFTVTSPQDFPSQSPEAKMTAVDSPLSTGTQDTGVRTPGSPDSLGAFLNSPVSPTRQFLDSELSDIVDKLGNEDMEDTSDLFSSILGNNSSPFTISSTVPTAKVTTVVSGDTTKGIPPGILETTIHRLDTMQKTNNNDKKDNDVLPDELAEFSMEFCDKLVDQMAETAMSQWGGTNMDLTEMPELPSNMLTWFNRVMATPGDACLLNSSPQDADSNKPLVVNSNGQSYIPSSDIGNEEEENQFRRSAQRCSNTLRHSRHWNGRINSNRKFNSSSCSSNSNGKECYPHQRSK
ncbi:hypoxia-inducible factor 1-alpha-like isoform X2 [Ptychodera flava]